MSVTTRTLELATNPAIIEHYARYGATPPTSKRQLKIIEERLRAGKLPLIDTTGMSPEARNAIPVHLRRPMRGCGRHWEQHEFRAIYRGISYEYDRVTIERKKFLVLGDVYQDGILLTLNWRVPMCPGLQGMCETEGQTICFTAEINRTGFAARKAGQPVLRGPFRKVKP